MRSVIKSIKIPGGKLLEIEMIIDEVNCLVKSLYITGDFFAYPPEIIDEAERSVIDDKINYTLIGKIANILSKGELYGITIDHVKMILKEIIEEALRLCK